MKIFTTLPLIFGKMVLVFSGLIFPAVMLGQDPPPPRRLDVLRVGRTDDITQDDVAVTLRSVSKIFANIDCKGDVSCPIPFLLAKKTFSHSAQRSNIEDYARLVELHNDTRAFVLIVDSIDTKACPGAGIGRVLGCFGVDWIAVVRFPGEAIPPGVVWAHEYGHTAGLNHRDKTCAVMNTYARPENKAFSRAECMTLGGLQPDTAAFRSPKKGASGQ